MPILFILFVVIPVVEILLLIKVGQAIGAWYTVGLVLTSAFIGVNMLRYQGLSTLARAKQRMDQGELPIGEMRDGIVIAVGGALLITPGFVTDFLGFCCLIPYSRRWFVLLFSSVFKTVASKSAGKAEFRYYDTSQSSRDERASVAPDEVIDGEFVDLDEESAKKDSDNKPKLH